MRVLFLDGSSGISGDRTVGALCDLGVTPSTFEWELSKLEIGDFHMHFERQQREVIEGVAFGIHEGATHTHGQGEEDSCCGHDHGHAHTHEQDHAHESRHKCCGHDHGPIQDHSHAHEPTPPHEHSHKCCDHDHGHSHEEEGNSVHGHSHGHSHDHEHQCCDHDHDHGPRFIEFKDLIEKSDLSDFVKRHAVSIFHRIAVAEGSIQGKPPQEVILDEVATLDSIAQVICVCVGIEQLGVEKIFVSNLHDGRGWVQHAHGTTPIPAAVTLEILKGIPVTGIEEPFELITPTGAAIIAEFGTSFDTVPQMQTDKIGYGIGSRKFTTRPNILRAELGELSI